MIKITTIKCGFYWLLLSLAPAAVAFEHASNTKATAAGARLSSNQ
jgi:hypothetical protein